MFKIINPNVLHASFFYVQQTHFLAPGPSFIPVFASLCMPFPNLPHTMASAWPLVAPRCHSPLRLSSPWDFKIFFLPFRQLRPSKFSALIRIATNLQSLFSCEQSKQIVPFFSSKASPLANVQASLQIFVHLGTIHDFRAILLSSTLQTSQS